MFSEQYVTHMRAIPTLGSPITMGAESANMAIICCIRYFQCINILSYPVSTMGPTVVGPGEKISKQWFPDGWKSLS